MEQYGDGDLVVMEELGQNSEVSRSSPIQIPGTTWTSTGGM